MDLDLLENFLENKTYLNNSGERLKKNNRCIRTILPVHVQGNIFDMNRFIMICNKYSMSFVEDSKKHLVQNLMRSMQNTWNNGSL